MMWKAGIIFNLHYYPQKNKTASCKLSYAQGVEKQINY